MESLATSPTQDKDHVVEFVGIKRNYLIDFDLLVHYTFHGNYVPNSKDWIGLFKVGWKNYRNYVSCVYAYKSNNAEGYVNIVEIPKKNLPREEDGNSYKFCYVSSDNYILGISKAFSFKKKARDLNALGVDKDFFKRPYLDQREKYTLNEQVIEHLERQLQEVKDNILKVKDRNVSPTENRIEDMLIVTSEANLTEEYSEMMQEISSLKGIINTLKMQLSFDIRGHYLIMKELKRKERMHKLLEGYSHNFVYEIVKYYIK